MNRSRVRLLIVLLATLSSGCVAVQFSDPNELGPDAAAKLAKQVPTYNEAQLVSNSNYIEVGSVDGYLCRQGLIGTLTDGMVITVLRQKAHKAGANGLTDISCEPGPIDELHGCMASIACQATMVKTVTPDTTDSTDTADK